MNFEKYATGWWWLDKLTFPFWMLYDKWAEWRFFRFLGKGDAERGRAILRRAVELADAEDSEIVIHGERWA